MNTFLSTLYSNFSWSKIIYSAVLATILVVILVELRRLWLDNSLYLGQFQYFNNGSAAEDKARTFTLRVHDEYYRMKQSFSRQQEADFDESKLWSPVEEGSDQDLHKNDSLLADLDITVQQINITDILTRLRRGVGTPNEVSGVISQWDDNIRISLIPSSRYRSEAKNGITYIEGISEESEAARDVACRIIWMQASNAKGKLASVSSDEFCFWAKIWSHYLVLKSSSEITIGGVEERVPVIEKLLTSLSDKIVAGVSYPRFFSLRAALTELLPIDQRQKYAAQSQNDMIRYAVLLGVDPKDRSTKFSDPLNEEAALAVLAAARPAAIINGDIIGQLTTEWTKILKPAMPSLVNAALATGMAKFGSMDQGYAVGFAVAPNIIATTGFNLYALRDLWKSDDTVFPIDVGSEMDAMFTFSDAWPSSTQSNALTRIKRVLYVDKADQIGLALFEIEKHDVIANPPLPITLGERTDLEPGRYVAVVSYPSADSRLPETFVKALLGEVTSVKRLLPGRIIVAPENAPNHDSIQQIATDVSTTVGTSGGPLIDLQTGRVIGVHYGGLWHDVRTGKFAYALSTAKAFADSGIPPSVRERLTGQIPPN